MWSSEPPLHEPPLRSSLPPQAATQCRRLQSVMPLRSALALTRPRGQQSYMISIARRKWHQHTYAQLVRALHASLAACRISVPGDAARGAGVVAGAVPPVECRFQPGINESHADWAHQEDARWVHPEGNRGGAGTTAAAGGGRGGGGGGHSTQRQRGGAGCPEGARTSSSCCEARATPPTDTGKTRTHGSGMRFREAPLPQTISPYRN